jgi:Fe-S cluster assembly ATP-binding protein
MLELKNISVTGDEKVIVNNVSLSLEEGAISVLMGPNGSGKSSLVNALMGHPNYKVTEGAILLNGEDITHLSTEKRAQKGLFLSLQNLPKIGGVTLASFLHKAYVATHASDISILEFYLELRKKADELAINPTLLDRPLTAGLSGGEKKLSEVMQLAILKPKFAILDEIDSGVDVDALHTVFKAVSMLQKEGTGFLVISHHPSLLTHLAPDFVHVMTKGSIVRTDGKELAEEILAKGFCVVAQCGQVDGCTGTCR